MADVKLNPILEELSGKVGDLVFRRYGDRTILARTPDTTGLEPSEAQKAQQERFRQATLYGKVAMADPEARALYEAKARDEGVPIFSVTVADFFHAPSVDEIDVSGYAGAVGDTIAIRASDDFEVTGVDVTVTDSDGNDIESGAAEYDDQGRWIYTATTDVEAGTTVRIGVMAVDRPGGIGADEAETVV